jgi:hypothetical protein
MHGASKYATQLRTLCTSFLSQKPRLNPSLGHVGFVVDKDLMQDFSDSSLKLCILLLNVYKYVWLNISYLTSERKKIHGNITKLSNNKFT